jgi:hypothetical protein
LIITQPYPDIGSADNCRVVGIVNCLGATILLTHIVSGGTVWVTLFGGTAVSWVASILATRLGVSVGIQLALAIGAVALIKNQMQLSTQKTKWLAGVIIVVVLVSQIALHTNTVDAATAAQEPDVRCIPVNGTYPTLASPEEKRKSSLHSIAIFAKFPKPQTDDVQNLRELKRGLTTGLRTSGVTVSYAVTASTDCTKPSIQSCREDFEGTLTLPNGRTAMLDAVQLTGPSRHALPEEYDLVIARTHPTFLEPDRVLNMLKLLQSQARVFYRKEVNRKFQTG